MPPENEEFVEVEIEDDEGAAGAGSSSTQTDEAAERTATRSTVDEEIPDDDEELTGTTDENRTEVQKRRKEERTRRRAAAKAREEGQRRLITQQAEVIQQLAGRVAAVERHGLSTQIGQVDSAINGVKERIGQYEHAHSQAVSLGNGEDAAAAVSELLNLKVQLISLENHKQQVSKVVQRSTAQPTGAQRPAPAPPLPAAAQQRAAAFVDRHKGWYNPAGNNVESKIIMAIDQDVSNEGFDPTTDDYWDEIEARAKNFLPHRINSAHNGAQVRNAALNSPVGGSSRSAGASTAGKTVFKLSAERVQAMRDSGAWDDPKRKQAAIKQFRDYDSKQKGGAA